MADAVILYTDFRGTQEGVKTPIWEGGFLEEVLDWGCTRWAGKTGERAS